MSEQKIDYGAMGRAVEDRLKVLRDKLSGNDMKRMPGESVNGWELWINMANNLVFVNSNYQGLGKTATLIFERKNDDFVCKYTTPGIMPVNGKSLSEWFDGNKDAISVFDELTNRWEKELETKK